MVNLLKCQFVKSAPDVKGCLLDKKQVVFLGRSNVGKSSLINAVVNQKKMAFTSKTPGRTQMLSYFLIDDKYYLVDAPGYGFYQKSKVNFEPLMLDYIALGPKKIRMAYVLLDARREISDDDIEVFNMLAKNSIPVTPVYTKTDKLDNKIKERMNADIKKYFKGVELVMTSSKDFIGIDLLRRSISKALLTNEK